MCASRRDMRGRKMLNIHLLSLKCDQTTSDALAGSEDITLLLDTHTRGTWWLSAGDRINFDFFSPGFIPGSDSTSWGISLEHAGTFSGDIETAILDLASFDWFDSFWSKIREVKFLRYGGDYTVSYKFDDLS
ncbi:hypothetical protein [Streptomyces sp. NBC_00207]|uniref:hypothetical protein n=1 Tax=unclassified Streptomyces TaxID=2593676 RepID=UPI002887D197|nr:hypothetical protein [Streptomyces sp. DSM 41633]